MTINKSKIISLILFILLLVVVLKENYIQKALSRFEADKDYQFKNNEEYIKQVDLYDIYNKSGEFVMLGNSITQGINWNELLNRNDILNRGIGNDVLEGFVQRLDNIESIKPKVCFIMGGINDIIYGIDSEVIYTNYNLLVSKLKSKNIIVVIQSTLYVSPTFINANRINKEVTALNQKLKIICKNQNILFLDLNRTLSKNSNLKLEYTYDGIHLNGKGYLEWKNQIKPLVDNLSDKFIEN